MDMLTKHFETDTEKYTAMSQEERLRYYHHLYQLYGAAWANMAEPPQSPPPEDADPDTVDGAEVLLYNMLWDVAHGMLDTFVSLIDMMEEEARR